MRLAKVRQHQQHCSPNSDEECDDEDKDLPLGDGNTPEETPVTSIGLMGT